MYALKRVTGTPVDVQNILLLYIAISVKKLHPHKCKYVLAKTKTKCLLIRNTKRQGMLP